MASGDKSKGRRLSAAQQAARDSLMIARRAQDWPWESVAAEAGISVSSAKRAVEKRQRDAPIRFNTDPVKVIERVMEGLQLSVGDLEAMASAAMESGNLSVAVGAKGRADDARVKLVAILQATGRLPQDLSALRHLIDLRLIAVRMLDAMDEFERSLEELPEEPRRLTLAAARRVREVFEELIGIEAPDPDVIDAAQLEAAA